MSAGAAGMALAEQSGDIAKGAGDVAQGAGEAVGDTVEAAAESPGYNVAVVILVLAIAYLIYKGANTASETTDDVTEGVGGAGQAVGSTYGDAYEGTQDFVEDSTDFVLGGTADTIKDAGEDAREFRQGLINTLDPSRKGFF